MRSSLFFLWSFGKYVVGGMGGKVYSVTNLFAHNSSRNPRPQGSLDYRNNVIYNRKGGVQGGKGTKLTAPVPHEPSKQRTAEEAFKSVLAHAGCSFPKRDAVDARIMREVAESTATFGNCIIDSPGDVWGWLL